jgi:hypothetical protein
MHENLAAVDIFCFLYSIAARGLERTPINGAGDPRLIHRRDSRHMEIRE